MSASHSGHSSMGRFRMVSSSKTRTWNSGCPSCEKALMRFKISIMGPDFAFFAIAQTPMTIGPLLDHFLAVGVLPGRSESLLRASCELAPLGIRPGLVRLLRTGAAMRQVVIRLPRTATSCLPKHPRRRVSSNCE